MPAPAQTDTQTGLGITRLEPGDAQSVLFEHLNAYTAERQLRRYQSDIWREGSFSIRASGNVALHCDLTLFAPVKAYAWRFCGGGRIFWLASSGPNMGYAINALIDPDTRQMALAPDADLDIALAFARYILAGALPGGATEPCYLLAGHQNFAHFIWNEMSGLLELEGQASAISGVLVSYEPIAPLTELIAFPPGIEVRQIAVSREFGAPVSAHAGVLFSVGAEFVSANTQRRVAAACAGRAGGQILKPACTKRIWLSLRTLYRTAVNELEAFQELIALLSETKAPCQILLDGYSLPSDLEFPFRYYPDYERSLSEQVRERARRLIEMTGPSGVEIIDLTGCNLPAAIAWAATADVYICHHGTQQHKIGWLNATPGMIHVNPHVLRTQPAHWMANQAHGAILPDYLPGDMVEDQETATNTRQHDPYFRDYNFIDPKAAARAMFAFVCGVLGT